MHAILAATDLTGLSAGVLPRAARLARRLGTGLVLCHVLEQPEADAGAKAAARAALDTAWSETADAMRADPEGPPPTPACRVLHGRVDAALAQAARDTDAGLIVLGLHQPRAVADVLRMTTMERTVLAAPVPVLLAHGAATGDYARVLAATKFTPACTAAARMAARIAPGAPVASVHAVHLPLLHRRPGPSAAKSAAVAEAAARADAWRAGLDIGTRATPTDVVTGGVHQVLRFAIEDLNPDLIAVGRSSGARPGDLGHYARDLMRAPPADLLVAG